MMSMTENPYHCCNCLLFFFELFHLIGKNQMSNIKYQNCGIPASRDDFIDFAFLHSFRGQQILQFSHAADRLLASIVLTDIRSCFAFNGGLVLQEWDDFIECRVRLF